MSSFHRGMERAPLTTRANMATVKICSLSMTYLKYNRRHPCVMLTATYPAETKPAEKFPVKKKCSIKISPETFFQTLVAIKVA